MYRPQPAPGRHAGRLATIDHVAHPGAARIAPELGRGGSAEMALMKTLDAWIGWLALALLMAAWSLEAQWLMQGS